MADQTRSESVNVDQIMRQVRSRIAERQGVDYTDSHVHQLASTRLEAVLDPKNLRPDLLEQFKRGRAAAPPAVAPEPAYTFEDATLFESTRAPLRWIRRLLLPILKLFFNPNPLIQALHIQARLNVEAAERDTRRDQIQAEWNTLYYDVIRAVVNETSRAMLETRSLKLTVESLQGRLDFAERRARALEEALQSRGGRTEARREPREPRGPREGREPRPARESRPEPATPPRPATTMPPDTPVDAAGPIAIEVPPGTPGAVTTPAPPVGAPGAEPRRRRRRRRRGRRGGVGAAPGVPTGDESIAGAADGSETDEDGDEGDDAAGEQAAPAVERHATGGQPPGRSNDPESSAQ